MNETKTKLQKKNFSIFLFVIITEAAAWIHNVLANKTSEMYFKHTIRALSSRWGWVTFNLKYFRDENREEFCGITSGMKE